MKCIQKFLETMNAAASIGAYETPARPFNLKDTSEKKEKTKNHLDEFLKKDEND